MLRWLPKSIGLGEIDPQGRRLLGFTTDTNEPVWAPTGHGSVFGANGAGKSTRVSMVAIYSYIRTAHEQPVMVCDVKDGELVAQCAAMLERLGIPVSFIDDMNVRPELARFRVELNPFGAIVAAYISDPRDVIFAIETITNALIPEPTNDQKNRYWRAWARLLIEFAIRCLLRRDPSLCTPGAAASILADFEMLVSLAEIEAEEGDAFLQSLAKSIIGMRDHEHMPQHLEAAQDSLRLFAPGTRLHEVGRNAKYSHADLIRRGGFIFLVGSQRYMERLGNYVGMHLLSFTDALYAGAGSLNIIADEWTNFPARELIARSTTLRAYGGSLLMISQSPSEVIRKFGEKEAETAEDNSITKQWLGFSNFREAEKASRAIGDEHAVASALGSDNGGFKTNTNLSLIKQRQMTPAELMAMPKEQCLVHIKGIGFMVLNTVSQETIAPFCDLISDNPLEGGRLKPDPKLRFKLPEGCQ